MGIKESNYSKEMDINSFNEYLNKLKEKSYKSWYDDYVSRLNTACILMNELGIGNRIIEFCDADIHTGNRLETYSDFLKKQNCEPIIISKKLETGLFGDVETINSVHDDFGYFKEYVCSSDNGIYNTVDSFIVDDTFDRFEKYLYAFLSFNKDCYFPISCYNNTKYKDSQLEKAEKIIKVAKDSRFIMIEEAENINNDNYVKVIRLSREKK